MGRAVKIELELELNHKERPEDAAISILNILRSYFPKVKVKIPRDQFLPHEVRRLL